MPPTTITDVRTIGDQRRRPGRRARVLRRHPRLREAARRPDQPDHALDRGRPAGRGHLDRPQRPRGDRPTSASTPASGSRCPTPRPSTPRCTQRGVTVGDLLRWDGVPPMFTFDDPDGNRFYIVEEMR